MATADAWINNTLVDFKTSASNVVDKVINIKRAPYRVPRKKKKVLKRQGLYVQVMDKMKPKYITVTKNRRGRGDSKVYYDIETGGLTVQSDVHITDVPKIFRT